MTRTRGSLTFWTKLCVGLLLAAAVVAAQLVDDVDRWRQPGDAAAQTATSAATPPPAPPGGAGGPLDSLVVAPETNEDTYDRDLFGDGWTRGPDGCDTRDAVLAAESLSPVVHAAGRCDIERGDWVSLYDSYRTPDPTELEIDHLVPLAEAWSSGASAWTPDQRLAFANDLDHADALIAVTAATNRAKSDKDPAAWMPPSSNAWCRYAAAWVTQKARWGLTVDVAERDALHNVLARCPQEVPTP